MSAQFEVMVSMLSGAAVAVVLGWVGSVSLALLVGWDTACVIYLTWIWTSILRRDAAETARRATRTDPDRAMTDAVLLTAAVASLVAVGIVLAGATHSQGAMELVGVGLALASVVLSWAMVHTVFTLRYAHLYYAGRDGGIDFNETDPPTYSDFAYLAFTIGMTFQVSDTAIRAKAIRRAALRQALLSYLFGTGILATTINLVASLTSR